MAIAFQSKTSNSGVTNSLLITKPAGTVSGDFLITFVSRQLYANNGNQPVTPPAGWTAGFDITYASDGGFGGGPGEAINLFYKVAGGAEPANYTFTLPEARSCIGVMLRYSGASIYNPVDTAQFAVNNAVENTPINFSSNLNNTYANSMMVVGVAADIVSGTISTPAGTTSRHNEIAAGSGGFSTIMGISDQFVAGAGASLNPAFTADDTSVAGNFRVHVGKDLFIKPNVAPNTPTVLQRTSVDWDTTPDFSCKITDPDTPGGQPIKARFEIYEANGITFVGSVDSATTTTNNATVTATYGTPLVPRFYKVRAKTIDDEPLESGYTAFVDFEVKYSGAAILPGDGDLVVNGTITTLANGAAILAGQGDLVAFPEIPEVCAAGGYGFAWYGGMIYAGTGYCPSGAVTPLAPEPVKSAVLSIDESIGRLGCGVPSFFITNRCAGGVTCVLDGVVTSAKWTRALDDVSTAEVTVQLGGDTNFVCCQCLSETEPWCHELHIWRDGIEMWVGPIQEIEYSYNTVQVRAKDVLAWLGVRIPLVPIGIYPTAQDLTTTAMTLLTNAFALDAPNTCEIDGVYQQPSGVVLATFAEAYNQTALEILRDLGELGLNFTTLGRTIVLTGNSLSLTPLVLLNDEHIMGDIKVTKDGTLQGNRFFVHFDGDGGTPVTGEAVEFYCYNAIERLRDGDGLSDGASAGQIADSYAAAAAIAPRIVEIPAGSRLSPDTPWTINQMVPGARVDVAVTRLCVDLTSSFILTEVEVNYNEQEGESIGITLTPLQENAVV